MAEADRLDFTMNRRETDDESAALELEMLDEADAQSVQVKTEKLDGRKRRISASIQIPYAADQIWQILTDYDHLADFIPSLTKSQRIEHPQGGIRLEQIGAQSFLRLKFCARVVLDMFEKHPHQLDFLMIEGDFKEFFGSWQLQPLLEEHQPATHLNYTVQVIPHRAMPVGLIERKLSHSLVLNLTAIRQRAEALYGALL